MRKDIVEFPGFTEPKPALSKWVILWLAAIIAGVIALGTITYNSLLMLGLEWYTAGLLAFAVEVLTFGAGWNLVRGNKVTLIEIALGLVTSGVYNYLHFRAQNVAAITKMADTDWLLIGITGVGPLVIIFAGALYIGRELHRHDLAVAEWRKAGKKFTEDQAQKAVEDKREADRKEDEERLRKEEADRQERERREQMQMQLDFQKRKLEIDAETQREAKRMEEERKAEVARIRIEAKQNAAPQRQENGNLPNLADWRNLPAEDKALIHSLTTAEIVQRYNVKDRTARYWKSRANGNGKAQP